MEWARGELQDCPLIITGHRGMAHKLAHVVDYVAATNGELYSRTLGYYILWAAGNTPRLPHTGSNTEEHLAAILCRPQERSHGCH